jgi:hypothetical protein
MSSERQASLVTSCEVRLQSVDFDVSLFASRRSEDD